MHDALVVGRGQRIGDAGSNVERLADGHRPAPDPRGQVLAGHQFHRQEHEVVLRVQTVHGGDVGVVERGECAGLALEAGTALGIGGQRLGQHLDGDLAAQRRVERLPDHAHAALAELVDDAVVQQGLAGFDGQPWILRDGGYSNESFFLWRGVSWDQRTGI